MKHDGLQARIADAKRDLSNSQHAYNRLHETNTLRNKHKALPKRMSTCDIVAQDLQTEDADSTMGVPDVA